MDVSKKKIGDFFTPNHPILIGFFIINSILGCPILGKTQMMKWMGGDGWRKKNNWGGGGKLGRCQLKKNEVKQGKNKFDFQNLQRHLILPVFNGFFQGLFQQWLQDAAGHPWLATSTNGEPAVELDASIFDGLKAFSRNNDAWRFFLNLYHPWDEWYIYLLEWLIFMVNVGKYTIHGWYG